MLQFQLGVQGDPVVEVVVEEQYEAVEIDVVDAVFREVGMQFAVAAHRGVFPPARSAEAAVADFFKRQRGGLDLLLGRFKPRLRGRGGGFGVGCDCLRALGLLLVQLNQGGQRFDLLLLRLDHLPHLGLRG